MKVGLAPVFRTDATILVLGSLPGDASLAASRYYAHPRNDFWTLIGAVIGTDLAALDYPERLEHLQSAGIALWDVVGQAVRPGSLDQKITQPKVNDLSSLLAKLPYLRAIAFNGKTAAKLGVTALIGTKLDLIPLPSSSSAYTLGLKAKQSAWSAIGAYARPLKSVLGVDIFEPQVG